MKHSKKRILRFAFALLMAAALSRGIGVGEVQAGNVVTVSSWNDLYAAIVNGGAIKLDGDVIAATGNSQIDVSKDVVLDLDGHIIDRNLTEGKYFGGVFNICDNATLTIQDNSTGKTGKITGGWNRDDGGGCITVQRGGTLNLEGGSIDGNKNVGMFLRAGGVYNHGTFNMSGGKITGNTAGYGAGVLVFEDASFNMTGGEIIGNICSDGTVDKGAGVYAYKGACVTLGGEVIITGNTNSTGAASNLYISNYNATSYAINLSSSALTGNAAIGISTEATDTVAITTEGKDCAAFFVADDSANFEISTNSSDNCIYLAKKGSGGTGSSGTGSSGTGSSGTGTGGTGTGGTGSGGTGSSGTGSSGTGTGGTGSSGTGSSGTGSSSTGTGSTGNVVSDVVSTAQLDEVPKTGSSDKTAIFFIFGLISGVGAVIVWKDSYGKK